MTDAFKTTGTSPTNYDSPASAHAPIHGGYPPPGGGFTVEFEPKAADLAVWQVRSPWNNVVSRSRSFEEAQTEADRLNGAVEVLTW